MLEYLEDRCTPSVTVTKTFTGLKMGDPGNDAIPPDVNGAAGPDRVIETVNSSISIFDRTGALLSTATADSFFATTGTYDPLVMYDEYAQRFVIFFDETDSSTTSFFRVAVSNTSSPSNLTSDWTEKQSIDIKETLNGISTWGDFPRIGYNADAWVISFNQFGFNGGFQGVQVVAIDKATYLDQNVTTHTEFKSNPSLPLFTITPAQMHGAAPGSPLWMISSSSGGDNQLHVVQMNNVLTASPTFTDTAVDVTPFSRPGTVVQPGGNEINGGDDSRILAAAWDSNRLVATHDVDAGGDPGVAWYEFNTSAAAPSLTQEGLISPGSGIGAMKGSIDISPNGAIGLSYMQASSTEFLSIYVTGQNPGDPLGTMQTPVLGIPGLSAYDAFDGSPFRLGDYTTVVVDPLDGSFWATSEFADSRSTDNWATGIVQFNTGLSGGGGGGGGGGGNTGNGTITASPNPVDENHLMVLDGAFSDPNGTFKAHTVKVDWGDKSAVQTLILSAGMTSFKMNHVYQDNGVYTIDAAITASGFLKTDKLDVTVNNLPPTATIIGVPPTVQNEGKSISVGVKVTDPSPLDTFTYLWTVLKNGVDFSSSTSPGLTFTPDDQGLYKVFLTVTDDDGGSAQASPVSISVQNVAPVADTLTNDGPKMTTQPVTISFVNPHDADADVAAGLTYDYDFNNDGTWDLLGSNSSSAQHTYGVAGNFTAAARIHDKDGATSQTYLTDVVVSDIDSGNGGVVNSRLVAAGSDSGKPAIIRVYDKLGNDIYTLLPYQSTFLGGVRVATGDVNGDHVDDIIAVNGAGLSATVKVYDGTTGSELPLLANLYTQQASSAFPASFKSGLMITTGDINGDGYADVVIGPSAGAMPVQVISGKDGTQLAKLFPFGTGYTRGVSLGVGDVTGDRVPDLVVGQAVGSSTVAVFSGTNLNGSAVKTFAAFPTYFTGGVTVAVGDTDGDRRADIVVGTSAQYTYDSRVRVFNGATFGVVKDFVPFAGYRNGVRVAVEDLDGDGKADLLLSSGKYSTRVGATPRLLALKGTNLTRLQDIQLLDSAFLGGVWVG